MITWLVLDLGDVVLKRTEAIPDLAKLLDVAPERMQTAYWSYRRDYDSSPTPPRSGPPSPGTPARRRRPRS